VKALVLRSLVAAIVAGLAINIAQTVVLFRRATRYEPGISEAEFHQMENMKVSEMENALAKRRIVVTRWAFLRESVHYSYFWRQAARDAIVPTCGIFFACLWVGYTEQRRNDKLRSVPVSSPG